jgi:hypothetical protein
MRYIFLLITCSFLFAQCTGPDVSVYPTASYDTLGIKWTTIERNNIIYYFQGTGVKGASVFTDMHEDAYNTLSKVFNPQLPQKLRFFVWTDHTVAQQKLGKPLGFTVSEECVCFIRTNQSLGHEMTHALSYWAGGIPPTTFSRFVNEGVAVAFDLNGNDKIGTAKAALAGKNVSSVTDFWSGSLQSAPEEVFYPVAGAFIEFLYNQNMPEQFNALLKKQTMENAQSIYGQERLDALIKEFDSRVL